MERLEDVATVETPEQLQLSLPLAGVGSRALAYIIDFLIQLIPIVIAMVLLVVGLALEPFKGSNSKTLAEGRLPMMAGAIFSAITFATNFLYFTFFDLVSRGQSPGKRALGLRVVRDGGLPIDARSSLIRNFVRTADMLPGFYLFGLVSMFVNEQHKRIGDLAGGTLVIRDHGDKVGDASVLLEPTSMLARPAMRPGTGLKPEDRALVNDFIERRSSLPDPARANVARQIAEQLGPRYGVDPTLLPDAVIDELAKK
jgi:uncharacterized RDD family membrane protein YckC